MKMIVVRRMARALPYSVIFAVVGPFFTSLGLAQTMNSGWYWPTGSSYFCGYLGWLGYNSAFSGYHLAQDMCNSLGNPVYSIGQGTVLQSRTDVGGYGANDTPGGALIARYQSADGTWFTALYGHLDSPHAAGSVSAGVILGYTSQYNPPHLHFGIHPGYDPEPTDPWRGYTASTDNTYGFTDPIPFLNAHPYQVSLAQISFPASGSTLSGTSVTFSWNSVSGADSYWLDVGNSAGQGDIFGQATTATSQAVGNVPCGGRTIYVQLWTHFSSGWQTPNRYTYTAASGCSGGASAQISSPTSGSTLSGTSVTFSWSAASGATNYWLDVGSSVGQGDISAGATTATSKAVSNLPCDGRTVYVQLWTQFASGWQTPNRYAYTACTTVVNNQPDLVVTLLTAPPSGTAGGSLSGTQMTVKNQGGGAVGAFRVGYYFSTSAGITSSSVFSGTYCNVSNGLGAGSTFTCTGNIGIPSLSTGVYYLVAMADDQNQVSESNESNNARVSDSGTVTVSGGGASGLYITSITPNPVILNAPTTLVVRGGNFQTGFTASVITGSVYPINSAGLTFVNTGEVHVQVTMGGTSSYTATLQITNPGGQAANQTFQVINDYPWKDATADSVNQYTHFYIRECTDFRL